MDIKIRRVIVVADEEEADWCDTFPVGSRRAGDHPAGTIIYELPHQCEGWRLGSAAEAREVIRQIEAAIAVDHPPEPCIGTNPRNYPITLANHCPRCPDNAKGGTIR